jgi:hypothetical protein
MTARAVCIRRNTAHSLIDRGVDVSVFGDLVEFVAKKILQHPESRFLRGKNLSQSSSSHLLVINHRWARPG